MSSNTDMRNTATANVDEISRGITADQVAFLKSKIEGDIVDDKTKSESRFKIIKPRKIPFFVAQLFGRTIAPIVIMEQ